MREAKNLVGKTFSRLTVIERAKNRRRKVSWLCRCSCGAMRTVDSGSLISGQTKSCGCLRRDRSTKHGLSGHISYDSWYSMMNRCNNKKSIDFTRYGERGITVCKEWQSVEGFVADMGEKPSFEYSIDRIDNNKGYFPANCRWATVKEQAANRRTNVHLTLNGETKILAEWATIKNIKHATLLNRINRGWTHERALTTPVRFKSK